MRREEKAGLQQLLPRRSDSPITFEYAKQQDPAEMLHIPRWHAQLEVKYFLRGGAEISCGPNCFLAQTGELVVINPYEYHSTRVSGEGEPPVYHMMNVDLTHPAVGAVLGEWPAFAEGEQASYYLSCFVNRIGDGSLPCVQLFLLLAEDHARRGRVFDLYRENLLRAFLLSLLQDAAAPRQPEKRHSTAVLPALQYIDAHFDREITVSHLASLCMLSVSRFSHLFRAATGSAVLQYVNRLRVSKASLLLTTTDLTVAQVAARVGCGDAAYFSRLFRKNCGLSPGEYRRSRAESV